MAEVWIVESGDYEQRGIDLVTDSPESAIKAIKARFPSPYIVAWDEPTEYTSKGETTISLQGVFGAVLHYSVSCVVVFDITKWQVVTHG